MTAAGRKWKSALSPRFTLMISSLNRRYSRRVSAEQVEGVRFDDGRAPDVDLTDMEIVQLLRDLKNQLTVMTLSVNAIRDGVAHGPADRLSGLQRSAERAVRLIEALLIDERPQTSARTFADLNEVVRRTAATLSHVEDNAIRLRLDRWPEPLRVLAGPGALERVLLNLLLNAYDAMPNGGVLTIETAIAHAGPAAIETVASWPLRARENHGYRLRHDRRGEGSSLRRVLHDQAEWHRVGTPLRCVDHPAASGTDIRGKRARTGHIGDRHAPARHRDLAAELFCIRPPARLIGASHGSRSIARLHPRFTCGVTWGRPSGLLARTDLQG